MKQKAVFLSEHTACASVQGRLHHRKLGANAPKKFQGGGRFDVEPGGNVSNSRNFVS